MVVALCSAGEVYTEGTLELAGLSQRGGQPSRGMAPMAVLLPPYASCIPYHMHAHTYTDTGSIKHAWDCFKSNGQDYRIFCITTRAIR